MCETKEHIWTGCKGKVLFRLFFTPTSLLFASNRFQLLLEAHQLLYTYYLPLLLFALVPHRLCVFGAKKHQRVSLKLSILCW
jgi:hypothetical protein